MVRTKEQNKMRMREARAKKRKRKAEEDLKKREDQKVKRQRAKAAPPPPPPPVALAGPVDGRPRSPTTKRGACTTCRRKDVSRFRAPRRPEAADECAICLEDLDDASPALACGHKFHAACMRQLADAAWGDGNAPRTRGGIHVRCPLCQRQSRI